MCHNYGNDCSECLNTSWRKTCAVYSSTLGRQGGWVPAAWSQASWFTVPGGKGTLVLGGTWEPELEPWFLPLSWRVPCDVAVVFCKWWSSYKSTCVECRGPREPASLGQWRLALKLATALCSRAVLLAAEMVWTTRGLQCRQDWGRPRIRNRSRSLAHLGTNSYWVSDLRHHLPHPLASDFILMWEHVFWLFMFWKHKVQIKKGKTSFLCFPSVELG